MLEIKTERNKLVEENLGLVYSCANRFKGRGVDFDDLVQAGCVGLIKAADNFDKERGYSFSTYAVPVILGEIKRIFRDGGTVKIGRAVKEKSRLVMKQKDEITVKLGREPTVSELAETLGMDQTETAMLLNATLPVFSLTVNDNDEFQIDLPVESHENEISDLLALRQVINSLDERDKTMIELRYYGGMTQSRIADKLGMTQVQVSRREKIVLEQMRKKLTS
ncbi:MAG: sigma-70 family RNA polymerase sigma factor [Acutalibacteraceae bacterium]|nr:sigma-70 family RNA polymerase sigma factor [Acutalibacteraceae bacterium]